MQLLAPSSFFVGLGLWWRVAKEIDVEREQVTPTRSRGALRRDDLLKCGELCLQLLSIEHGGRNAAQATCLEDGRCQGMVLGSSHGRLDQSDGMGIKK
jgi:hypothetical protein